MKLGGLLPACGLGLLVAGAAGTATAAPAADTNNVSDLEQVTVYAPFAGGSTSGSGLPLGGTTVTQSDMQQFNRDTLDRAFVLASGTSVSLVGARNETDIWIRGFDRWRVPLYQDGIPVYLALRRPHRFQPLQHRRPGLHPDLEGLRVGHRRPGRDGRLCEPREPPGAADLRRRSALPGQPRLARIASRIHRGCVSRHPPVELVSPGLRLIRPAVAFPALG